MDLFTKYISIADKNIHYAIKLNYSWARLAHRRDELEEQRAAFKSFIANNAVNSEAL